MNNQFNTTGTLQGSAEEEKLMLCPIIIPIGSDREAPQDLDPAAAGCKHLLQLPCCRLQHSETTFLHLPQEPACAESKAFTVPCMATLPRDSLGCLLYGCFTDAFIWRHMCLQSLELTQKALGLRSLVVPVVQWYS